MTTHGNGDNNGTATRIGLIASVVFGVVGSQVAFLLPMHSAIEGQRVAHEKLETAMTKFNEQVTANEKTAAEWRGQYQQKVDHAITNIERIHLDTARLQESNSEREISELKEKILRLEQQRDTP